MKTLSSNGKRIWQVFGHAHGYPYGLTVTVEADTIEEAHEDGEQRLDEVVYVREIAQW